MRKFVLIVVLLALMAVPAMAEVRSVAGAKIDMPYLIRFTKNWTLGVEGGKDIIEDVFRDRTYIEDDKGVFGYIKITFTGTLFDFSKK